MFDAQAAARSSANDNAHNAIGAGNNQSQHRQNQINVIRNPHYENIYESIDQFANRNAPAPAESVQNAPPTANNGRNNTQNRNNVHYFASISHPRNGAYDVPRPIRNYYASNVGTANRRATFESNTNRMRYANVNRGVRQRSFDDTESYHYSQNNNIRYENIYEQIREEPNLALRCDNGRLYGRLDVIGHGIGRIERHLSSSCGNLDHYNLGGTYAILGHSHLSTVGHVYASNNTKESAGKSSNFFSCLGRENSQSMSNICGESSNASEAVGKAQAPAQNENANKSGAIAKTKKPNANANTNVNANSSAGTMPHASNAAHSTALNRMSKSSMQWLLVNKWLPLWIGNGSDCNRLDFNFMFSRNCDGCERGDNVVVYDESNAVSCASGSQRVDRENHSVGSRPMRNANSLMRFNENNPYPYMCGMNGRPDYRPNQVDPGYAPNNNIPYRFNGNAQPENPFRRWELNSENNSFRPASVSSVRRITDGTYPYRNVNQEVRVCINQPANDPIPSTSAAARAEAHCSSVSNAGKTSSSLQLRPDRKAFEKCTLTSSTESASETENKVLSPDLSAHRYSENTEDDQYNSGSSSSSDDEGNNETISEPNANDTDNSDRTETN